MINIKYIIVLIMICINTNLIISQTFVVNYDRAMQIAGNGAIRLTASENEKNLADNIKENLKIVNQENSKFLIVKEHIFHSLKNVNSALEQSKQVLMMGQYIEDIIEYNNNSIEIAGENPHLLIFTQAKINYMTNEIAQMSNSLYNIVLNEDRDLLMNYQARQEIINQIRNRLLVCRGMSYSLNRLLVFRANNSLTDNMLDEWFPNEEMLINDILNDWGRLRM